MVFFWSSVTRRMKKMRMAKKFVKNEIEKTFPTKIDPPPFLFIEVQKFSRK